MEYEKLAMAPEVASAIEVDQAQGGAQSNDGVYTFDKPQPKFGLIHAPAGAGAFEQQLGHRAVYAGTKCAQFGSPTAQTPHNSLISTTAASGLNPCSSATWDSNVSRPLDATSSTWRTRNRAGTGSRSRGLDGRTASRSGCHLRFPSGPVRNRPASSWLTTGHSSGGLAARWRRNRARAL